MTSEVEAQANSAVYYEKRYSGWGLRYHKSVIDWMLEGIWPDQLTLDAGCGTGIIKRLFPSHHLVGVDVSEEMVKRCPEWPLPYAMVQTVTHLQVYPEYEAVVCRSLLHHLPDHKLALKEFHRVLKPGGKLVLWETNKGWLAQQVRRRTQHGDRFSEYHHAFRPGELEADLRNAGFLVQEVWHSGFLAYPLFGFPDIIDFTRFMYAPSAVYWTTMFLDSVFSKIPFLRNWSWAVGIKAVKV